MNPYGYQSKWKYANGYTASVISNTMSMGGKYGYFEVAVMHGDDDVLCYSVTSFNHPIGWLSYDEVQPTLDRIRRLGENPICNHRRKDEETT